jgi:hypothetical protein
MWILPSTISPSAPATAASTLDSEQFSRLAEQSLAWRSKPSPARTWSRRWKRVSWIRHLSSRICTPSTHDHTVGMSGFSVAGFLASRSVKQAADAQTKTLVTCFHRSNASSTNADPGASSWKTSRESFLPGFKEPQKPAYSCMSWTDWRLEVTRRRGDCSARRNAAHRIAATASSSWQWPTPQTSEAKSDTNQDRAARGKQVMLCHAVKRWPTATVGDSKSARNATANRTKGGHHSGTTLTDAITLWPTATARDWKDGSNPSERVPSNGLLGRVVPRDPTSQHGQLNPDWVERLMGLPRVGWTDFDC